MKIILSNHARIKMRERRLLEANVFVAVENPDLVKITSYGREERYKKFRKNWLKVIVVNEGDTLIIITAHWMAKIKQ